MFYYNFISKPSFDIDENIVKDIFIEILTLVNKPQNWILNIVFVSPLEIKELNKNYRQKDYETDVLSFHYFEDFSDLTVEDIAWELVFCEEKIISQWQEYWLGSQKEFYKLLIHSILHILWYDHENDSDYEIMQPLEEKVWNKIFVNN